MLMGIDITMVVIYSMTFLSHIIGIISLVFLFSSNSTVSDKERNKKLVTYLLKGIDRNQLC